MRRVICSVVAALVLVALVATPGVATWSATLQAPAVAVASVPVAVILRDTDPDETILFEASKTDTEFELRADDWVDQIVLAGAGTWVHPITLEGSAPGSYGIRYKVTDAARTGYALFPVADAAACTPANVPASPADTLEGGTNKSVYGDATLAQVFCLAVTPRLYETRATATVDRFDRDDDWERVVTWSGILIPDVDIEFTIETFTTST
jgi:hypothetical protein